MLWKANNFPYSLQAPWLILGFKFVLPGPIFLRFAVPRLLKRHGSKLSTYWNYSGFPSPSFPFPEFLPLPEWPVEPEYDLSNWFLIRDDTISPRLGPVDRESWETSGQAVHSASCLDAIHKTFHANQCPLTPQSLEAGLETQDTWDVSCGWGGSEDLFDEESHCILYTTLIKTLQLFNSSSTQKGVAENPSSCCENLQQVTTIFQ